MTQIQHVDYASTYFPHKTPTLVRGEPSYKDLKRVKMELRANASSVDSELGGGDHGYLGLVLSNTEYLSVPGVNGTRFTAPAYPGALVIPQNLTDVQALQLRETHKELIQNYRECCHVEKALLKHLQGSFQPQYFEAFVDDDTALLSSDIPIILDHLYNRYGQVTGTDVQDYLNEVLKTPFTPAEPLVTIWNPIQKLKKLAIQAKIPYSDNQLIEFALQMIRATHDFEMALGKWEKKPIPDKTWVNLKLHFSEAQEELKRIRGPTMAQAGFHQINSIATEIRDEFSQTRTELANMTAILHKCSEDSTDNTSITGTSTSGDSSRAMEAAMATAESTYQLEILKLLKSMQDELANMKKGEYSNNGNGGKGSRTCRKTPDNPNFTRRKTDEYCWTHGGCAHSSNQCTGKAPGHKKEATFDNKMGGSKAFCE